MCQDSYTKFAAALRRRAAANQEAVFAKIAERLEARMGTVKSAQSASPAGTVGYNLTPQRDTFRKGMLSGGTAVLGGGLALSGLTGENRSFANRVARLLGGTGIAYAGNRYATDAGFRDAVHATGKKVLRTGMTAAQKLIAALSGEFQRV